MGFDVDAFRAHFPSLDSGIAHFDGPGGTQTPRVVGETVSRTLIGPLSNRFEGALSEQNAEDAVTGFRAAFADFFNCDPGGIVYGRSATQLTYDIARAMAKTWRPGDEVVVSRLDHDANVSPWLAAAESAGAEIRWIDFDPATAELVDLDTVRSLLTERTRVVALTAASNLLGTMPPVRQIADAAHGVGALVYVDSVHFSAHRLNDLPAMGADLAVCSPYKFFGPHCAVLAARPEVLEPLRPDRLAPATDEIPERFELGTLPYETMAGATAAVDFIASIGAGAGSRRDCLAAGFEAFDDHEQRLLAVAEAGLLEVGATVYSRAGRRTPTLLATFAGRKSFDAYRFLLPLNVLAPAGFFYAHQAELRLGIGDTDALRMGLAPYTTDDDIARLLDGLAAFVAS
jgi:cysteine desulfurase family protein (TIGR01976 family)